ncbi:MAG: hypothetical protein IKD43_01625 [Clostridia bacterium]|nr:hypothetical protein [Clostridia bacterium]
MNIDIIDLTDPAYVDLNVVQLAMVRVAQTKKNKILVEADSNVRKLLFHLLENDNARSYIRTREEENIRKRAQAEVETVREDLLHQLAYEELGSEGNEFGPYRYPENPNYNLTTAQRFLVVRNYYMEVVGDSATRLAMFGADTLARSYLGEFYQTLYDLLASYVR